MLLALDISTTQTGYAIGAQGRRPKWGVFRPGNMPREERIQFIAASVRQAVLSTGCKQVIAEAVSVGSFKRADGTKGAGSLTVAVALAEAHGAIKNELIKLGIRMTTMNLASARSQLGIRVDLGIKGAPKKADVQQWLKNQSYPTVNDDEADALVIWLAVMLEKTGTNMDPTLKVKA